MRVLFFILLLTLIWLLLTVVFTVGNFILGLIVSSAIVLIIYLKTRKKAPKPEFKTHKPITAYIKKFGVIIWLCLFFIKVSLVSSFNMFYDVLVLGKDIEPSIVGIKIVASSEIELVILSNLITLTPGNLALEFEEDKSLIYVHLLNGNREESFRKSSLIMDKKIKMILG